MIISLRYKDISHTIRYQTIYGFVLRLNIDVKSLTEITSSSLDVNLETNIQARSIAIPYHTQRTGRVAIVINNGDSKDILDLPKTN